MNNTSVTLDIASPEYALNRMKSAGFFFEDDLSTSNISEEILKRVPLNVASDYQVIPYSFDEVNNELILVTYTDQTLKDSNRLAEILKQKVNVKKATEDNVKMALMQYYQIDIGQNSNVGMISNDEDTTPLKRKIDTMLQDAAKKRVSDIHLRPMPNGMCVEFRINGHLVDFSSDYDFRPNEIENVINIIKTKDESGNANVTQVNLPNSGYFSLYHGDVRIDVRMSTVPLVSGSQKVNLRLLPQEKRTAKLEDLGYLPEDLKAIRTSLIRSSTGMFLISGETGSGKTTSLYAQIEEILDMRKEPLNVMTIENPVEIHNPRFCQIQVKEAESEKLTLSAPKILNVCLRQDPNIILYGEIRDKNDAEVAIEAAKSGHKVFSTVHAKNCVTTISRLFDLGVSKTSLLSELNMIMSQKLIGVLCPDCSHEHELTKAEKLVLTQKELQFLSEAKLREPGSPEDIQKCKKCKNGYIGRTVVAEYIQLDMELRDLFLKQNLKFSEIANILENKNFRSMWDKAFDMVLCGKTDLMEIINVIGKE